MLQVIKVVLVSVYHDQDFVGFQIDFNPSNGKRWKSLTWVNSHTVKSSLYVVKILLIE